MKRKTKKPSLPAFFLSDLRCIHQESESGLAPEFFDELRHVHETGCFDYIAIEELRNLERKLNRWSERRKEELRQKLDKLPPDHPIKCPISLLEVKGYGRTEVAHTRILAWLLDPNAEHGFRDALLNALLRYLHRSRAPMRVHVESAVPEWYYKNFDKEEAGRTDIRIEGSLEDRPWLLVIEAKIDSSEGDHQLERYDREIKKWQNNRKGVVVEIERVFLTPDRRPPNSGGKTWTALSFADLARVFWGTADSLTMTPGYHFLRYYLAGVMKNILHLPIGEDADQLDSYKLLGFLKAHSQTT
jgi:hypothetical protein